MCSRFSSAVASDVTPTNLVLILVYEPRILLPGIRFVCALPPASEYRKAPLRFPSPDAQQERPLHINVEDEHPFVQQHCQRGVT